MATGAEIMELVVRAIATEVKVSEEAVRRARSLKHELKMDSIAAVNVIFALEEQLAIEIEVDEGDRIDSVDDIVELIARARPQSGGAG